MHALKHHTHPNETHPNHTHHAAPQALTHCCTPLESSLPATHQAHAPGIIFANNTSSTHHTHAPGIIFANNTSSTPPSRAAGEEPLPEDASHFKQQPDLSQLDNYLIANQIAGYCDQVDSFSSLALQKLQVMQALQHS